MEKERITLMIIGNESVGKTSFIKCFKDEEFNPHISCTIGLDFNTKAVKLEEKVSVICMWDCSGNEKFRFITVNYYDNSDGIIIVCDSNDDNVYENILKHIESIEMYVIQNKPLWIVISKGDLANNDKVKNLLDTIYNEYPRIPVMVVSSFTGKGVNETFTKVIKDIREKGFIYVRNLEKRVELIDNSKMFNTRTCCW
jgi:small GTP-binding protein